MFAQLARNVAASATIFGVLACSALAETSPEAVEGAETISVDEAAELFDAGAVFVDVRSASDFDGGRIPGAFFLDSELDFSQEALAMIAQLDEPLVLYCNGIHCGRSSMACEKAVSWGYTQVKYFRDGFPAWDAAGLPVE